MSPGVGRSSRLDAMRGTLRDRYRGDAILGARAPGRVNLIGEHTDYNDGLVLPIAIDLDTFVLAAPRRDTRVRCFSMNLGEEHSFDPSGDSRVALAAKTDGFDAYVEAVVRALIERGSRVAGVDLVIDSLVPLGAGLSSSAALTVSLAQVLSAASGTTLDAVSLAEVAHRAESHFMGIGSGILDQFASALGGRNEALRIDCRTREVTRVRLPPGELCLLVADSGVRRRLAAADSGYQQRVAECGAAVAAARAAGLLASDATALRDLREEDLPALARAATSVAHRRARHVVTENARVEACCTALGAGDLRRVGELFGESHASLRDDYEVSIDELDVLCSSADAHPGVYGSRLVGAGFGGCTLHLVERAASEEITAVLANGFEERFGRCPPIFEMVSGEGASLLELD